MDLRWLINVLFTSLSSSFSNLWLLLYKWPFVGGLFSGLLSSVFRSRSSFSSVHGFVPGLLSPAEGLHFWTRWLSSGLSDCTSQPYSDHFGSYLSLCLSKLQSIFPPFISCYLGHSLVVDRLWHKFPQALFVRVKRSLRNSLYFKGNA